ncbi:hypothetical protein [Solemya velum gill symbiont]|uniref:hypothetical protein n=2 Tax=Solemya velum gill symbiont TaxID=2340 RepID=UPI0018A86D83|nr:hypothetical protein [Solemya velum gill symbiont]
MSLRSKQRMKYHTFILAGCLALLGACSQSEQGSAPATDTKVVEETAAKAAAEEAAAKAAAEEAAAKVAAEEAAAKAAAEEASTPSMEEKTMMEKAEDAVDAVKSGL